MYMEGLKYEQQENKNATVKVMGIQPDDSSYTELNKPVVIEGRMPQAANECEQTVTVRDQNG